MDLQQAELQIDNARRVAKIETLVEDMHDRLFGNGQPGDITIIKERVTSLEHSRALAKGAFGVITAFLSFVGWSHVKALFSK